MQNLSKTGAILACKCPRCRQGDIFQKGALSFWSNRKINEQCLTCNQRLEPEPGFYFGAMYVSYGFSVAIALASALVLHYIYARPDILLFLAVVLILTLALMPFTYRYSRSIFLHLFGGINFDAKYKIGN